MSKKEISPVTIRIMDKDYVVSCLGEERDDLVASARILDEHMKQARDVAKIYGVERIAVMSALNLIHGFLQRHREQERELARTLESAQEMAGRIDTLLAQPPAGTHSETDPDDDDDDDDDPDKGKDEDEDNDAG